MNFKKWWRQLFCKHEWEECIEHNIAMKNICKKCGNIKIFLWYF